MKTQHAGERTTHSETVQWQITRQYHARGGAVIVKIVAEVPWSRFWNTMCSDALSETSHFYSGLPIVQSKWLQRSNCCVKENNSGNILNLQKLSNFPIFWLKLLKEAEGGNVEYRPLYLVHVWAFFWELGWDLGRCFLSFLNHSENGFKRNTLSFKTVTGLV